MRGVGRFLHEQHAMAEIVQFTFMFLLLLGFFGGFATYALALHARSVVIQASFAAARTASVECDSANPSYSASWPQDTVNAAEAALRAGMLHLSTYLDPSTTQQPGAWFVTASCQGGVAAVGVSYNQVDVFPVLGPVLLADQAHGWSFTLHSAAQVPTEG